MNPSQSNQPRCIECGQVSFSVRKDGNICAVCSLKQKAVRPVRTEAEERAQQRSADALARPEVSTESVAGDLRRSLAPPMPDRKASVQLSLEERLARVETLVEELSVRLRRLEGWRDFEIRERSSGPEHHQGHQVIGRIPLWASGRYLLALKTERGTFDLDIV